MRGFINGIVFTLAVLVAAAVAAVKTGALYPGADAKPPDIERLAARTSLRATIERDTKGGTSPIAATDANLSAGVHLYANNCAICHGAADGKKSTLASGFYVGAPQLATDGVEDDPPAETYWKLRHGIRFSAMPAFGSTLSDEQLWQLALFLSKMDKLPAAVDAEWKRVPSVAASPSAAGLIPATPQDTAAPQSPEPSSAASP